MAGLVIVFTILALVVFGKGQENIATVQILLVIAAGLLGLPSILRREEK